MSLTFAAITFDCSDAEKVAAFWSGLLGRPVDDGASGDFASIGWGGSEPAWFFQRVPEGRQVKNRVHPDLMSSDHEADVERALGLGARRIGDFAEAGVTWTTLADPEGNEFDIAVHGD
jgi:catechol 2,3-dioxygenase-like lactoylglutathione lyase family enzyme